MQTISLIALDWAIRCFGREHVSNESVRALRVAEEAIELGQSLGVPKETMLKCVEVVYSRAHGQWHQELGGVLLTAVVLAASKGVDPEETLRYELRRVLGHTAESFARRNSEKIALGLTA